MDYYREKNSVSLSISLAHLRRSTEHVIFNEGLKLNCVERARSVAASAVVLFVFDLDSRSILLKEHVQVTLESNNKKKQEENNKTTAEHVFLTTLREMLVRNMIWFMCVTLSIINTIDSCIFA